MLGRVVALKAAGREVGQSFGLPEFINSLMTLLKMAGISIDSVRSIRRVWSCSLLKPRKSKVVHRSPDVLDGEVVGKLHASIETFQIRVTGHISI